MSTAVSTLSIRRIEDGSWSLIVDDLAGPTANYPTPGQAIAGVYELASEPGETEVLIHEADGRVLATVTIRRVPPMEVLPTSDLDEDPIERAEALRLMPSYERFKAGIGKYPPPPGDFDNEEMAC